MISYECTEELYLKGLPSKHESVACPLPLDLTSDLPCGICSCKWENFPAEPWLALESGLTFQGRVTLGNPFSVEESALRMRRL